MSSERSRMSGRFINAAAGSIETAPAAAALPPSAHAAIDADKMLQANGCTACHGVSNKIVGPSFRDIARRYSSTADAAEYLSGRIRKGSDGVWGAIPMPEQSQVKDADRRALAQWLAGGANCTTQSTGRVPHPLTRMGTNPEGARHHDERKC